MIRSRVQFLMSEAAQARKEIALPLTGYVSKKLYVKDETIPALGMVSSYAQWRM